MVIESREWLEDAACGPKNLPKGAEDVDWYSSASVEKKRAKAICQSVCPDRVRRLCLQDALDHQDIWGIHGGVDQNEIRRDLCVDVNGDPKIRSWLPRCPYCMSKDLNVSRAKTKKGYATQCKKCELRWYIAIVPPQLKVKRSG